MLEVGHVISLILFRILQYLQRDLLQKLNSRSLDEVPRDGVFEGLGSGLPCAIPILGEELVHLKLYLALKCKSHLSGC